MQRTETIRPDLYTINITLGILSLLGFIGLTNNFIPEIISYLAFASLLIISIVIFTNQQFKSIMSDISAHVYLLYGSYLLFLQNTILFLTNLSNLMVSQEGLTGTITQRIFALDLISQIIDMYRLLFVIDLIGFGYLILYFYFVRTTERKQSWKPIGTVALIIWLTLTLLWRTYSGFFTISSFEELMLEDYLQIWLIILTFSQIALGGGLYAFSRLNQISDTDKYDKNNPVISDFPGLIPYMGMIFSGGIFLLIGILGTSFTEFWIFELLIQLIYFLKFMFLPIAGISLFYAIYKRQTRLLQSAMNK